MDAIESIEPKHLDGSPKKVGLIGKKDLFQLKTKGGLYLLVAKKEKGFSIVGSGPHRAIARHIATKNHDDVVFTELSKSDHIPVEHFTLILPQYEALTLKLQKLNGDA